jgi:hypothetical protein
MSDEKDSNRAAAAAMSIVTVIAIVRFYRCFFKKKKRVTGTIPIFDFETLPLYASEVARD